MDSDTAMSAGARRRIAQIVEAAVERSVVASLAAFERPQPEEGPADQALL
jgi:hypothetical protein